MWVRKVGVAMGVVIIENVGVVMGGKVDVVD